MAGPKIGAGTTISYATMTGTSISSYTNLARVQAFKPAEISVAKVPLDAFDNATFNGNPVEDDHPGWVSPGDWGITLYCATNVLNTLRSLVGVDNTPFKVVKSDGSGYTFTGFIDKLSDPIPLKEYMTIDGSIHVNGGNVATFALVQS